MSASTRPARAAQGGRMRAAWSSGRAAAWAFVCACAFACGSAEKATTGSGLVRRLLASPAAPPSGPVAARFGAQAILAEDVKRRLLAHRAEGDEKVTAREVADELALETLAAAEARTQGLVDDPAVEHATRQAMVQALIEREFEPTTTQERIPEDFLKRTFERNFWFYNHPEIRGYEHLLVWAPVSDRDEPRRLRARALTEALRDAVAAAAPKTLKELAVALTPRAKAAGFELRHEAAAAIRTGVEKDFGDVLFETPVGEVGARVAESRFGLHVVLCTSIKPKLDRGFAEVREDVRSRSHPGWRQQRFVAWTAQLRAQHHAQVADMAHLLFRKQAPGGPARPKPSAP